jgi:two-component system cell cycle response regulator
MTSPPARILVVDDEPQNLELMEAMLLPSGYEVALADSGQEALAAAQRDKPDLVLLDLMMPGISGFEVCARLKGDPETRDIPVLFVSALSQAGDRERAIAAGGDDFLMKPVQRTDLLTRVEGLLKMKHMNRDLDRALASLHELELARHAESLPSAPAPPAATATDSATILVVDDEHLTRQLYADVLRQAGYAALEANSGPQALEIVRKETVDVVLLDIMMPGMSGLDVLDSLGELIPDSPVIIVTAHPSSDNAITALRLGAFDFMVKGFKNEVMLSAVSRALERRRQSIRNHRLIGQLEAKIQEIVAIIREYSEQSGRRPRPSRPA